MQGDFRCPPRREINNFFPGMQVLSPGYKTNPKIFIKAFLVEEQRFYFADGKLIR
jgi:hypothetical protein